MANGEATGAPDKRSVAGAVPAATTTFSPSCKHCAAGNKPVKLKRQYVHKLGWTYVVCRESTLKLDLM